MNGVQLALSAMGTRFELLLSGDDPVFLRALSGFAQEITEVVVLIRRPLADCQHGDRMSGLLDHIDDAPRFQPYPSEFGSSLQGGSQLERVESLADARAWLLFQGAQLA
jgi:hypothetical protein